MPKERHYKPTTNCQVHLATGASAEQLEDPTSPQPRQSLVAFIRLTFYRYNGESASDAEMVMLKYDDNVCA